MELELELELTLEQPQQVMQQEIETMRDDAYIDVDMFCCSFAVLLVKSWCVLWGCERLVVRVMLEVVEVDCVFVVSDVVDVDGSPIVLSIAQLVGRCMSGWLKWLSRA